MDDNGRSCDAVETHLSWVFFTPDRAYKLLKPVVLPFIDHTDAQQRIESIRREFELNRTIAPDVYLGTSDLIENEEIVDQMLVMRRLPDDRRLAHLLTGADPESALRPVAHAIASLHAGRSPVFDAPMDTRDAVAQNWRENFEAIEPFVGSVIDADAFRRVRDMAESYLHGREQLFQKRIDEGWIRDVHGDLTAADIFCLDDGPRLIDCLAFNDRWRIIDVLSDIGFLIMDVHRLAGRNAAERLMRWYQEFSNEHHPPSLAHHYVAYRAHVRAKIACLRVAQGDQTAGALARSYHDLALHHLERGRLRVILVGGGPGVGKSTLADRLGSHFGFPVLSTDDIRKSMTGGAFDEHQFAAVNEGIYTPEQMAAVYEEQRRETEIIVRSGSGVVLDATWARSADRAAARAVALSCGAEVVEIECVLDAATAQERIETRLAEDASSSDATPALVRELQGSRDSWPESLRIDTDAPIGRVAAYAIDAITQQPTPKPNTTTS